MHAMSKSALALLTCATILSLAGSAKAAAPIPVMILDGESGGPYHDWQNVIPVLKKELEEAGLFHVDVMTAPPSNGDFSHFHPDFNQYRVVVLNYDGPDWPADLKSAFENYVSNGGGVVSVHAADNAFPHGFIEQNDIRGRLARPGREFRSDVVLRQWKTGTGQNPRASRLSWPAPSLRDNSERAGASDSKRSAQSVDARPGRVVCVSSWPGRKHDGSRHCVFGPRQSGHWPG